MSKSISITPPSTAPFAPVDLPALVRLGKADRKADWADLYFRVCQARMISRRTFGEAK